MRRSWWLFGLFAVPLAVAACSDEAASPEETGAAGTGAASGKAGASAKGGTGGAAGTNGEAGSGGSGNAGTGGASGAAGKGGASGAAAKGGAAGEQAGGTAGAASGGAGGGAGAQAGGSTSAGSAGSSAAGSSAAGSAGSSAAGSAGSAGAAPNAVDEIEPNGGGTLAEVNPFVVGTPVKGAIGKASDADIFKLEAVPGKVYVVRLTLPVGSKLSPHLAVFDAGRGKKGAGLDYTKIGLVRGASNETTVEILAMGEGGYFIGVRDERNVDDPEKGLGDAAFTYQIDVAELAPSERVRGPLALPGKVQGTFASPGALHLFSFDVTSGQALDADFSPDGKGLDGRFFVYSATTKDWAARNDNRSETDVSPRFDAVPLSPAGPAYLVVENIEPTATSLGYAVTSK